MIADQNTRNSIFDLTGRQMAIENLFLAIFDLRSSIVLTFSIAT